MTKRTAANNSSVPTPQMMIPARDTLVVSVLRIVWIFLSVACRPACVRAKVMMILAKDTLVISVLRIVWIFLPVAHSPACVHAGVRDPDSFTVKLDHESLTKHSLLT